MVQLDGVSAFPQLGFGLSNLLIDPIDCLPVLESEFIYSVNRLNVSISAVERTRDGEA